MSSLKQVLADPRFIRQLNAPDAARLSAEGGGVFSTAAIEVIEQG